MSEIKPNFELHDFDDVQPPSALEQHGFVGLTQQLDLDAELGMMRDDFGLKYGKMYVFGFHSILKDQIDEQALENFDEDALLQVAEAEGFIAYHPGERDWDKRALSWCLWQSIEHSHQGTKAEAHLRAVANAKYYYEVGVAEHLEVDFGPEGTTVTEIKPPQEIKFV